VLIVRYARFALITPSLSVLREHLLVSTRRWNPTGAKGTAWTVSHTSFYENSPDGMIVPLGAVPRLAKLLIAMGYQVTVEDRRGHAPQITEAIRANPLRHPPAVRLAEIMLSERSGLIAVGRPWQAWDALCMAAELVSPLPVLIVVSDRHQVGQCQRTVGGRLNEEVGELRHSLPASGARIQVCTIESFIHSEVWTTYLVLVPDAECAAASVRFNVGWSPLDQCPIYGFVDESRRFDRLTELRMETLFGARIFWPTACEAPFPINVAAYCDGIETPGRYSSEPLEFKREAIWHNARRNEHAAGVAQAIASREPGRLWRMGWRASQAVLDDVQRHHGVAVLVEGLEHAREVHRLLPDWSVIRGGDVGADYLNDKQASVADGKSAPGLIVTYQALDAVRGLAADVIVRADAGIGSLNPQRLMLACRWTGFQQRVTVVDFTAAEDVRLRKSMQTRLRAYQADGYSIEGAPADVDRRSATATAARARQALKSAAPANWSV